MAATWEIALVQLDHSLKSLVVVESRVPTMIQERSCSKSSLIFAPERTFAGLLFIIKE